LLLIRIAVGNEVSSAGNEQRESFPSDVDLINSSPQLFQGDFSHQPASVAFTRTQSNGNQRRWKHVFIKLQRSDVNARFRDVRWIGQTQPVIEQPTGCQEAAPMVEERNLAKLREIEDMIPEDPRLLPRVHVSIEQLGTDGPQDPNIVIKVQLDAIRHLCGDLKVAGRNRILRASSKVSDRYQSVQDERSDGS
jgi:hypothetical protein